MKFSGKNLEVDVKSNTKKGPTKGRQRNKIRNIPTKKVTGHQTSTGRWFHRFPASPLNKATVREISSEPWGEVSSYGTSTDKTMEIGQRIKKIWKKM